MDYGAIDVILEFDAGETRKCVNVSIVNDLVDEENKTFTYHLRKTTNLNVRINLEPIDGTVEIIDDDGKYMLFHLLEWCCWFIRPTTRGRVAPEGGGRINRNTTPKGGIKCLLPLIGRC